MDTLRPDTLRPFASCHVACRQPLPLFPHISRLPVVSFHDCISLSDRYPFRPAGTKNPLTPSSIRKYGSPAQGGRRKRGAVRMDGSSLPSCSQQAGTLIADGMTRSRWCTPRQPYWEMYVHRMTAPTPVRHDTPIAAVRTHRRASAPRCVHIYSHILDLASIVCYGCIYLDIRTLYIKSSNGHLHSLP